MSKKVSGLIVMLCVAALVLSLAGCNYSQPEDEDTFERTKNSSGTASVDTISEAFFSSTSDEAHAELAERLEGDVLEIKDRLFVAQTNDIYLNAKDYLGRTIKYEGIFDAYYFDLTDETYYSVIRYGPGCCGFDDNAGFEVIWEDENKEYPAVNDWVEIVGVLEDYEEDGYKYLRIRASELNVLDERGAEYVFQ